MRDVDVLIFDRIAHAEGGDFRFATLQQRGVGGSEIEILQVARGLTQRGYRVAVANGHRDVVEDEGVLFVPNTQIEDFLPTQALYLQRMSVPHKATALPDSGRIVVRANDVYCPPYDVHRPLLESGRAALVANTRWQADLFGFAKERIVISPMLDPVPLVGKTQRLFVYASGPMKGLEATLAMWRLLWRMHPSMMNGSQLVIISPGWGDFSGVPEIDREIGVRFEGAPTPEKYREWIARAEGIFFVNTMPETFGNVCALAECSRTRTHVLCRTGIAGLAEAVAQRELITESQEAFVNGFFRYLGQPTDDFKWTPVRARSPEAIMPEWEKALELTPPKKATKGKARKKSAETALPAGPLPRAPTDTSDHAALYSQFKEALLSLGDPVGNVTSYWRERAAAQAEFARTKPVEDFLAWSDDVDMHELDLFTPWYRALQASPQWDRWKRLSRKAQYGKPHAFSLDEGTSPVGLQHAYHLMCYEQMTGARFLDGVQTIVEVGGGYGNFARMLREDGFRGTHVIIDLPQTREFQKLYLGLNGIRTSTCGLLRGDFRSNLIVDGVNLVLEEDIPDVLRRLGDKTKGVAFVATWSLSETPLAFRSKLFPALFDKCGKYLMATQWPQHHTDGIANDEYFTQFMKAATAARPELGWRTAVIDHHPVSRCLFAGEKLTAQSVEQTFADDPSLASNKEPMGPFFGDFLSLLRGAIAPGGSELGVGLTLFSLAASIRAANIVEIGRFKGFSTLALAAACKLQAIGWREGAGAEQRPDVDYAKLLGERDRKVISIDPSPTREADELIRKAGLEPYVAKIDKASGDVSLDLPIDLLFIDGSHMIGDVQRDVQKYVPLVRPGGYFVMHDYYGWFQNGKNGSPIARVIEEDLGGFERVLIDTGFASMMVFRNTATLEARPEPVPKRADGRPTVGLVVIAKGDEASTVIARAIVSAKKIGGDCTTVVCAAQDKVAEVSRHLGADVFIRPSPKVDWEQGYGVIAGARNEALKIAERRTDYVLLIDADDWIGGELPKELTADGYEMLVYDGGMVYPRIQLFRAGRGFRFHGIRHEHLVMGGKIERTGSLRYYRGHSSYGFQDQDPPEVKYSKHAKDLTKWLIDHPDDARAQFYLARSYQDAGRVAEAIVAYEKRLAMTNGWDEERFYSAFQIGLMAMRKGEDPTQALLRAHEIRPTRAEPLVVLAQWHRDEKRKHFSTAYAFARRAAAIPMPNDGLFMQAAIYEFEAIAELAICAYWVGNKAESLEIFRKIAATCAPHRKEWADNMVAMCAREVAA